MSERLSLFERIERAAMRFEKEAADAAEQLAGLDRLAGSDLVTVRVDPFGRITGLMFARPQRGLTTKKLSQAVLEAYVEAAAEASTGARPVAEPLACAARPPALADDPSRTELVSFDLAFARALADQAFEEQQRADERERVVGSAEGPVVTATVTASGRLRRIGFHHPALSTAPDALADETMHTLDEAADDAVSRIGGQASPRSLPGSEPRDPGRGGEGR